MEPNQENSTLQKLQAENEKLRAENEALKRSAYLMGANQIKLGKAVEKIVTKAEKVQGVAKETFDQNMLRLKVYELKLISYYNKLVEKYPVDEDISNVADFIAELKKVVNKDFFGRENFEVFASSRALDKSSPIMPPQMISPSESGFDFFEALNPNKDLETLCRELGLMTEE